jgi:hypothetical protein
MTGLDLERLAGLLEKATADWCVYGEPEVGLPPSLFAGTPGQSGFGPLEPLQGYDLLLAVEAVQAIPLLIERVRELEATVRRVQSAAKTIMHAEGEELASLREKSRGDWVATKTLDSEREANARLTAELEAAEARVKVLEDALRLIEKGDTWVFDDDLQDDVQVSMDMEEAQSIATVALLGCTCCEVFGENPQCIAHGRDTEWAKVNASAALKDTNNQEGGA